MGSAASHSRVEPAEGAVVHLRNLKKGVSLADVMAPKKEVQFSITALNGATYLAPIVDVCPRTSSHGALDDFDGLMSGDNTPSRSPPRELRHEESSKAINNGMAPYRLFGPGTCRGSVMEPTFIEPTLELAKTDKARRSQDSSRRKSSSALLLRHVW